MMRIAPALVLVAALGLSACASSGTGGANGWAGARPTRPVRTASTRPVPPRPAPERPRETTPPPARPQATFPDGAGMLIPVVGVEPGSLRDSFTSPRSGGRTHNAIDIMAPTGTPLLAITDGVISRKHWNSLGGHTLYLTSADGRYDFYYAHLSAYEPGIEIGSRVRRGDVIGAVGSTGNAQGPHLHLQVLDKSGSGRGVPVNPYLLLRSADFATAR